MTRRFDVEGNELTTESSYQFEVNTDRPSYNWVERNILGHGEASPEEAYADTLNWAMTGSLERGRVQAGETATLTFSESQMQALLEQTQARVDETEFGSQVLRVMVGDDNGMPVPSSMDFAMSLARKLGDDPYGFADRLQQAEQPGMSRLFAFLYACMPVCHYQSVGL